MASSDDHLGYPGAYGEGVVGVWADSLTSGSLLSAIRARHTYALTGDRIVLEVAVNGQPMGSELPAVADRQIDVRVEGQDAIAMVELVRNGRVIERYFPRGPCHASLVCPAAPSAACNSAGDPGRLSTWDAFVRGT